MFRKLKIVICDPAELPRDALAHLLIKNCECEIVGAFARVGMAIEAANQHGADLLAIDLTDIGLRGQSRLIECLRAKCLNARLLALADASQARRLKKLQSIGVDAFMFTCEGADTLKAAVMALAAGNSYRSPQVAFAPDPRPPRSGKLYADPVAAANWPAHTVAIG